MPVNRFDDIFSDLPRVDSFEIGDNGEGGGGGGGGASSHFQNGGRMPPSHAYYPNNNSNISGGGNGVGREARVGRSTSPIPTSSSLKQQHSVNHFAPPSPSASSSTATTAASYSYHGNVGKMNYGNGSNNNQQQQSSSLQLGLMDIYPPEATPSFRSQSAMKGSRNHHANSSNSTSNFARSHNNNNMNNSSNRGGGPPQKESLGPELDPIYAKLEGLNTLAIRLEDLQLQYLADNEKRTQKKIENTINAINKDALEIKAMMSKFDQTTQAMASRGVQQNVIDIRKNQLSNCGKKLVECTKGVWNTQKDYEKKRTNQAAKRLKVRFAETNDGQGMTDADAQRIAAQLVQSGNDDQLFLLARDELERAMATKEAVLEIERAMRELYQMFCDLNVLVVDQGESMQEIEKMAHKAKRHVEKGNQQLKLAKKHQKACAIM